MSSPHAALATARDRVARLLISDPDPDRYDAVWNEAVGKAVREIEEIIRQYPVEVAREPEPVAVPVAPPTPHCPRPRDRAVMDIIRTHQPVGMGKVSMLLGTEAGGTIGRLLRKGAIRHPCGNVNLFEVNT